MTIQKSHQTSLISYTLGRIEHERFQVLAYRMHHKKANLAIYEHPFELKTSTQVSVYKLHKKPPKKEKLIRHNLNIYKPIKAQFSPNATIHPKSISRYTPNPTKCHKTTQTIISPHIPTPKLTPTTTICHPTSLHPNPSTTALGTAAPVNSSRPVDVLGGIINPLLSSTFGGIVVLGVEVVDGGGELLEGVSGEDEVRGGDEGVDKVVEE